MIRLFRLGKSEETARLERFNLKPIDKSSNVLRINRNEYFKSEAKEADSIALSYLQKKSGTYGLSGRKLNIL